MIKVIKVVLLQGMIVVSQYIEDSCDPKTFFIMNSAQ